MGAGYSLPSDGRTLADAMMMRHQGYNLYPCFFVRHDRGEVVDVDCIGCLSDFERHLNGQRGEDREFTILCLGDGKCNPCDAAKDRVRELQELGRIPNVRILEMEGGTLAWRTKALEKRVDDGVKRWAVV